MTAPVRQEDEAGHRTKGHGMIEHLTATDLANIAARGGSLEVNGQRFTALDLGTIAARLQPSAHLKICNCAAFTAYEIETIAARKPGQVIFS